MANILDTPNRFYVGSLKDLSNGVAAMPSAGPGSALFHRETALAPAFDAAIEGDRAHIAELAQGRGGQSRNLAELAADNDPQRRIGQILVDAQLELAARQMSGARDMAAGILALLAHIEDDEVVGAGTEPV